MRIEIGEYVCACVKDVLSLFFVFGLFVGTFAVVRVYVCECASVCVSFPWNWFH